MRCSPYVAPVRLCVLIGPIRLPDHDDPVVCYVGFRDDRYVGALRMLEVAQVVHVVALLGAGRS